MEMWLDIDPGEFSPPPEDVIKVVSNFWSPG